MSKLITLTSVAFLFGAALGLTNCSQQPAVIVQAQPAGYIQPSMYPSYTPYYEPGLAIIYVGGHAGYYDHYHVFQPEIVVGNSHGYRDSSGRFVSSAPEVKTAAASGRPLYGSPTGNRPASTQGLSGLKSAPAPTTTPAPSNRPAYGTTFAQTPRPAAAPISLSTSRPSYGSSSARPTSSFSSSSSRPSYGSRR